MTVIIGGRIVVYINTFATFPRDEQEEITKQVSGVHFPIRGRALTSVPGQAVRKSDACVPHLLLDISIDKRAEDIQDRAGESVRPQMRDPRDRRRWRADIDVRRRIVHGGDDC